MQHLGFRSLFAKLFASVMLALILFAVAMVLLTQLVHDKDASTRSEVVATQILGQIDPFLNKLNVSISNDNHLQSRFMLAVIKKSFDIFDESLQAKMGLYDNEGHLLMQTDNSDLPLELPDTPSLLTRVFPSFSDSPPTQQAQVYSSTGYTLLYESRLPPKKPVLSAALNLFTGTLLLLIIMAGVLWQIARSMTWRINQMSQQMGQLGDGDFSVRVNSRGNDEIALLAQGFNQAAQKIEQLIDANNLLLAHASHELRTPITRIRLQVEMMDMLASVMPEDTKAKFDKRASAINRDLSGLNDLVESILLVSRLDAGHAMQQVEKLDLYDLINQERQHYAEASLIGEHIVIDGQAPMLTHLIRNLLNNAMLHGVPPVTVLVYGVQSIETAGDIPDYLLQSIMCSSFAETEVSSLDYNDRLDADPVLDTQEQPFTTDSASLPSPIIYFNDKTLETHRDKDKASPNASHTNIDDSSTLSSLKNPAINDGLFINHHHQSTAELPNKLKKATWQVLPEWQDNSESLIDNHSKDNHSKKYQSLVTEPTSTLTEDKSIIKSNEPLIDEREERKEGLFKKHLKKTKSTPVCPDPKYAVMAVIDEGSGIPEDKREEIFSPFVRLQQKKKGSGLGLSLVAQIVTAHQGRIITDTINGHTRFLVVLPVKHDPHHESRNSSDSHNLNR